MIVSKMFSTLADEAFSWNLNPFNFCATELESMKNTRIGIYLIGIQLWLGIGINFMFCLGINPMTSLEKSSWAQSQIFPCLCFHTKVNPKTLWTKFHANISLNYKSYRHGTLHSNWLA